MGFKMQCLERLWHRLAGRISASYVIHHRIIEVSASTKKKVFIFNLVPYVFLFYITISVSETCS